MGLEMIIITLLPVIAQVESGSNQYAIGDNGKAVGMYQIHKICLDDVNNFYNKRFQLKDRLDKEKAKVIVYLYLRHWGKKYEEETGHKATKEVLARIHNGGPRGWEKQSTEKYWQKIKKEMEKE